MIGLALLFIFILIFFYQKYIHKRYKNLEEEKQNKIGTKLLYISLIFLPFFDISIGYVKTGLDIITAEPITVTDAGKKFKEDKNILDELNYINMSNYITKNNFYYYTGIDKNKEYYINFNCSNISDKDKEEILLIENEMKNKHKNIKIFKNSYEIIENKYYNSCTKELLFYNPYNKISNSVSFNTILYPLNALYNPSYYISFVDYTLDDYIFGNEFFNIKYFIIPYTLFVLFIFIFCVIKIKYIINTIYITTILIFLPFSFSSIIEIMNNIDLKNKQFVKDYIYLQYNNLNKDMIYESKYKDILIKHNKIDNFISNNYIEYVDLNKQKNFLNFNNKENKLILFEVNKKNYIDAKNYLIERIQYKELYSGKIILEKNSHIYKRIYTVDSLFGIYKIYK